MVFSLSTVRYSDLPTLRIGSEDRETPYAKPTREQKSQSVCFSTSLHVSIFSSRLHSAMFNMPTLIYTMAEDGLLFRVLTRIHVHTGTHIVAIMKTGVDCCTLLQGILPTQESNPFLWHLLHCRQILYPLSQLGSPLAH